MKKPTFIFAILLVLIFGFTNGDDISDDGDFGIAFDTADGSNDYNAGNFDYRDIFFDDIAVDDGTSRELDLIKRMFAVLLPKVREHLKLEKSVRYQENRFWNLTFLPIIDPSTESMRITALVNLEIKNVSRTDIESSQVHYDPLPGQYRIEAYLRLVGNPFEKVQRNASLHHVNKVADPRHPDAVQLNILNEVLPEIKERIRSDLPVRYGRFLLFNSLSTENTPEFSQLLQVIAFIEKESSFCREKYPQRCPYVSINIENPGFSKYLLVKQFAGNGTVVLADYS